jgi:hypothetical protein
VANLIYKPLVLEPGVLILVGSFQHGFRELGFKNWILECIQNIPGNRDVALWIPQSFLQERILREILDVNN